MPLRKRECKNEECQFLEDDRLEKVEYYPVIDCPKCHKSTFTNIFCAPHLEPDGLYSFMAGIDKQREAAHAGHGNTSLGRL